MEGVVPQFGLGDVVRKNKEKSGAPEVSSLPLRRGMRKVQEADEEHSDSAWQVHLMSSTHPDEASGDEDSNN